MEKSILIWIKVTDLLTFKKTILSCIAHVRNKNPGVKQLQENEICLKEFSGFK